MLSSFACRCTPHLVSCILSVFLTWNAFPRVPMAISTSRQGSLSSFVLIFKSYCSVKNAIEKYSLRVFIFKELEKSCFFSGSRVDNVIIIIITIIFIQRWTAWRGLLDTVFLIERHHFQFMMLFKQMKLLGMVDVTKTNQWVNLIAFNGSSDPTHLGKRDE